MDTNKKDKKYKGALEDQTLKTYDYVFKKYVNSKYFNNPKKQIKYLKESGYSPETIRLILSSIIYYMRYNKLTDEDYFNEYRDLLNDIRKETDKDFANHKLIKQDYIPDWEDIIKLREDYKKELQLLINNKPNSKKCQVVYRKYILLCLYTYQPPRREKDYALMRICNTYKDYKNYIKEFIDMNNLNYYCREGKYENEDKTKYLNGDKKILNNFYIKDLSLFVFWNYKTFKTYGCQLIQINKELANILNEYIDFMKLNNYDLLFKGKNYHLLVNETLRINGQVFGINSLRHAFIINFYNNEIDKQPIEEIERISKLMSHNPTTNMKYYKEQ